MPPNICIWVQKNRNFRTFLYFIRGLKRALASEVTLLVNHLPHREKFRDGVTGGRGHVTRYTHAPERRQLVREAAERADVADVDANGTGIRFEQYESVL